MDKPVPKVVPPPPAIAKKPRPRYCGVTYPKKYDNPRAQNAWKKRWCPKKVHLFDECLSDCGHRLICDACGFTVHILGFETEKEAVARVRDGDGCEPKPFVPTDKQY